jgi:hypothetical protein
VRQGVRMINLNEKKPDKIVAGDTDKGLQILKELNLITIDEQLFKGSKKFSDLFLKAFEKIDIKEKLPADIFCEKLSKEMLSEIINWWIEKQSNEEKEKWIIYKQKVQEMNALYIAILSINQITFETGWKNAPLSEIFIQKG